MKSVNNLTFVRENKRRFYGICNRQMQKIIHFSYKKGFTVANAVVLTAFAINYLIIP